MEQEQFEQRMNEALLIPFGKENWPATDFRSFLKAGLYNASPHTLGIKADVFRHLVRFADGASDDLNLTESAAALNCIEASKAIVLSSSLDRSAIAYQEAADAAKAWNEIVEPIKKKVFAEMAAQAKLQQTAPKGKVIKLAAGKKK